MREAFESAPRALEVLLDPSLGNGVTNEEAIVTLSCTIGGIRKAIQVLAKQLDQMNPAG